MNNQTNHSIMEWLNNEERALIKSKKNAIPIMKTVNARALAKSQEEERRKPVVKLTVCKSCQKMLPCTMMDFQGSVRPFCSSFCFKNYEFMYKCHECGELRVPTVTKNGFYFCTPNCWSSFIRKTRLKYGAAPSTRGRPRTSQTPWVDSAFMYTMHRGPDDIDTGKGNGQHASSPAGDTGAPPTAKRASRGSGTGARATRAGSRTPGRGNAVAAPVREAPLHAAKTTANSTLPAVPSPGGRRTPKRAPRARHSHTPRTGAKNAVPMPQPVAIDSMHSSTVRDQQTSNAMGSTLRSESRVYDIKSHWDTTVSASFVRPPTKQRRLRELDVEHRHKVHDMTAYANEVFRQRNMARTSGAVVGYQATARRYY